MVNRTKSVTECNLSFPLKLEVSKKSFIKFVVF